MIRNRGIYTRKRINIKESWGIALVSFLDLVIIIIALVLSTNFDNIQNLKDKMLESEILAVVVYIIVYLSYGIYFAFLIEYTLFKKHKNIRYYYIYFIQILLMTAIFNGLLLFGSYFTWGEVNKFTQNVTKEFQKEFYNPSTTIVNSIFVGVMAYLGVMLPKIIKNTEHRSNIYTKKKEMFDMKKKTILLMFISFILLFVSCGKTPSTEPTQNKTPTEQQTETFDEGYTLSFNIMGHGSAQASIDNIKSIPSVLPSLSAEGYNFDGWYVDEACTKKVELGLKLNQDTTLYAKWTKVEDTETPVTPEPTPTPEVITYTVTFNSNGGSTVASAEVEQNKKITAPTNPTKEGYIFVGWFSDESLTKAWKFESDVVTANTTLYAKWEEVVAPVKKYSVTFNINGHGNQPAEVNDVLALPLELPVLTAEGYTFLGWYTDEALTSKAVSGTNIKADTILYASWKLNTYKITYHINGHGNQPAEVTDVLALPTELPVLSEKGWTFLGWFMDENFSVSAVADAKLTADVTLYAKWEKESVNTVTTNFFTALQYEEYTDESIKDVDGIYKIIFNSDEVDVTGERYYNLNTNITLNQGYTIIWYADKDNYSSQLVTQRAHLEYGDNIYYATITNMNGQFLASYAFNIYVLHDYYFNYYEFQYGYKLANQHKPYYTERVIEGECTSLYKGTENGFSFKGWLTLDFQTRELVKYDFTQPTYRNVEFFASYEDVEITLNNQKNNFSPFLTDKLDIYVQSTIDKLYDGWYYNGIQYINEDNEIVTSISDHQIINKLSIEYVNETQNEYFKFTDVEDGYCIDLAKMPSYTDILIIPSKYNDKPVVTLGSTSFNDKEFSYIYIPNTVTRLEKGTLKGCNLLESITLPFVGDSIKIFTDTYQYPLGYIFGTSSYEGGVATEQYYYGSSTTSTTYDTYYIPSTLKEVKILGGNINFGAFYNCSSLTSVVIPNSVTSIGVDAFYNCNKLASIEIPDSVISIGAGAFYNCNNLTSIVIPNLVTSIGKDAFSNCDSLTSIVIPDSVTSIGKDAFVYCYYLTNVYYNGIIEDWCNISFSEGYSNPIYYGDNFYILDNNGDIEYQGNKYTLLTELVISNTVINNNSYAFYNYTNLINVYYNGTIEDWCNISFDYYDFNPIYYGDNFYILDNNGDIEYQGNKYTLLTELVIPNTVTKINNYSFRGFSNLTSVVIPDSVTSIGKDAFYNCSSLTSVVIPNSVTSIGKDAFNGCRNLTSIIIPFIPGGYLGYIFGASSSSSNSSYVPSSLKEVIITGGTSIGQGAFFGCSNLISIVIPDSVTSIEKDAFSGCTKLSYNIYDNAKYLGNENKPYLVLIEATSTDIITNEINSNTKIIYQYAFSGCSNLTNIVIPDSVTSINSHVFSNCSKLTSVVIGDSVTRIGHGAFYGCSLLESITLPFLPGGYLGHIFGADSYLDNSSHVPTSLKEVIITGGTSIGKDAFSYCRNLTSIVIGDSVTSIGNDAFYSCSNLRSIVIGDSVTSIPYRAFYGCSNLTSIVIGDSVTSIGKDAFENCRNLKNIYYNGIIEEWCNISFSERHSTVYYGNNFYNFYILDNNGDIEYQGNKYTLLTELVIPNTVTKINNYSFWGFSNLTSVVIPDSVTSIGKKAFSGCGDLTNIVIGDSVTSIEKDALYACINLTSIIIPFIPGGYLGYIFGASSSSSNSSYVPSSLKEVIITGETSIEKDAFYGCSNLTSIIIPFIPGGYLGYIFGASSSSSNSSYVPSSLKEVIITGGTSIGDDAFSGCSNLTSVVIPDSVTSIGEGAFSGCSNLTSIIIPFIPGGYLGYIFGASSSSSNSSYVPSTLKEVTITSGTSIGDDAFYGCRNLTNIEIPDSVTSIGDNAFYNCNNLTSIEIPDSVTSIGGTAFYNCRNLTNVYYNGTIEDWCNISFGNNSSNPIYYGDNFYILDNNGDIEYQGNKYTLLTELVIPNTVTKINNYSFCGFSNLTSVVIPDSVTSIGSSAFSGCSNLTSIEIPDSVTNIGTSVFSGCTKLSYNIYDNAKYLGNENKPYLVLIEATSTDIITNEINSNTKIIYQSAFSGCSNLTNIVIPDSVTSINSYVFSNCSKLTSVVIGDSVTSIGWGAFYGCSLLESITLPFLPGGYLGYIFGADSYLENSSYVPTSLKELIIKTATYIYNNAFYGCINLTSIVIPNSVTSIGLYAFYGCTSLKKVYYKGTSIEWNNITIDEHNSPLTFATRYYYSETKPTTSGNYWHYDADGNPVVW